MKKKAANNYALYSRKSGRTFTKDRENEKTKITNDETSQNAVNFLPKSFD